MPDFYKIELDEHAFSSHDKALIRANYESYFHAFSSLEKDIQISVSTENKLEPYRDKYGQIWPDIYQKRKWGFPSLTAVFKVDRINKIINIIFVEIMP